MTESTATTVDVIDTVDVNSLRDELVGLSEGRQDLYSSLKSDTFEGRLELLGAVTGALKIADHVNVPFNLKHVVIQAVELAEEMTGKLVTVPRVVLVDDEGNAFYGISDGLYRSVTTYIKLLGDPDTWPEPIRVVVKREGPATRSYFTMTLAPKADKASK